MKKCPNCQKEFPDTMRFCQSDGTPLVEAAETQAEDSLKTTVMRQEDIASSIPSSDPFKTTVGNTGQKEEEQEDLLQLPEEFDPMKTMVVPPLVGQNKPKEKLEPPPKFDAIKEEIKPPPPSSPYGDFPASGAGSSGNSPFAQPEPPKFNEPSVSPPNFGGFSGTDESSKANVQENPFQSPVEPGGFPKSGESPFSNDAPFGTKNDTAISSPFDSPPNNEPAFGRQQANFNEPPSPFGQPASPFDAPKSTFQEPENPFGSAQQQFNQMSEPSFNQPLQQNDWTPPPSPSPGSGWQEQGLGPQTPFQPPVAAEGQNKTLPIVSLVFGIISVCCYVSPVTGLIALVTGFLGMKNANNDPGQFGGKGLAIAGMITGGIFLLIGVLYWALIFLGVAGGLLSR